MAKRIILISSFPLLVAIAIIAIALAGIGRGQPAATPADIEQSKSQIISLVEAGKLAEADAAVDKIMALPTNRDKGAALQQIAWTYRNAGQADTALTISDYVLQNWPKEDFAVLAAMSLAISQIDKGNTADAKATTSQMIADYADNTDLAGALCVIADTYSWRRMYDRAGRLYRLVIDKSADISLVVKSRLGLARVEILGLIRERKFSLAQEKLDSMIVDFNDEPDLPTALFQAGQEFCWQHQYSESKDVFDHIKNLPDNSFTQQTKLWSARVNVCSLIGHAKDEDIIAGIDKLIKDFEGDAGLPETIHWIGEEYEEQPNKSEQAKQMYERLILEYPTTPEANKAALDIRRVDIDALIEAGDINEANALTDEFIADFNQDPYAGNCLGEVAIKYYKTAMAFKEQGQRDETKQYFAKSEDLWQWVIDNNSADNLDLGEAYFCAATCRQELGRWEEAIAYYRKVVDDYADFEYVGGAQCAIGWSYETLRNSGKIPKEQANPIIEQAYTAVLTKYPDCYVANYAAFQLAGMSAEKGDKISAIAYYKKFLELANPQDVRIASAKEILEKLERFDPGLTVEGGTSK